MRWIEIPCNLCGSSQYTVFAKGPDFEYRCTEDEFTFVKCSNCGLLYLNPRPAPSELSVIYPENYIPYRFDAYLSPLVFQLRMAVQRLKVKALYLIAPEHASIADVGCGGGFFLECLKKYGKPDWKLSGIDISEDAIVKIQAKGFEGICGRFETLDLLPESFNVIVLNQVIEHLDDPAAVIAKSYQLLKKGGYLFIETPSAEGWEARLFGSRYWGGWHFPRHWTIFTQQTLSQLLEQKSFTVVHKQWLLSPNFWTQSIHHWLLEKGISQSVAGMMDCKNPVMLAFFSMLDVIQKLFGHTSNMRVIAQKE